jgi:type II secretion system protein I
MRTRSEAGFTLLEVLVALAIAGGALVLVLSAVTSGFRQGAKARAKARLEAAAESKLSEWRVGAETETEGELAGFPGYRWRVTLESAPIANLAKLRRIVLVVRDPAGLEVLQWVRLVHEDST